MLFQEIYTAVVEISEALLTSEALLFCSMADINLPITQVCQRHPSFLSF